MAMAAEKEAAKGAVPAADFDAIVVGAGFAGFTLT